MISCTTHIFNATAASFMRHTKLGVETETLVTHSWSDVSRWNLTKIHIHHPSHEQEKVGKIQPGVSKPTFQVPCWVGTWNEPPVQSKVQVLLNTLFAFAVLLDQHSSQLAWLDLPFTFTPIFSTIASMVTSWMKCSSTVLGWSMRLTRYFKISNTHREKSVTWDVICSTYQLY